MKKAPAVMVSSSPGRDKLPPSTPDLTHLLSRKPAASRSRSRSRGRSAAAARSSPMFVVSRSRVRGLGSAPPAAAAEDGEPSSPKITCIGQVRMRSKRLAAKPKMPKSAPLPKKEGILSPCRCFLCRALLCGLFPLPALRKRITVAGGGGGRGSLWRKWARIRSGGSGWYWRRKPDPVRPPASPELVRHEKITDRGGDEAGAAASHEETASFLPTSAAPPKNALLLMRCRSAPHNRASSIATGQFAMPPLHSPEPLDAEPSEKPQQETKRRSIGNGPLVPEVEAVAAEAAVNDDEEDDIEAKGSESQRPLVLPRSKSEPAGRASAKLALPEASYCFWTSNSSGGRRRRSGGEEHQKPPPLSQ